MDMLPPISEQDQTLPSLYEKRGNGPTAVLETNQYFYPESFRPLLSELEEEEVPKVAQEGGAHDHTHHHAARNALLPPGVYFTYEIYPFAVEITCPKIPVTHSFIRILAAFGGVFTIVKWVDAALYARDRKRGRHD
jgi:hypothetical protein